MALPLMKIEEEVFMEERVARLEVNVEHIRSDISEIKIDIRRLDGKMDAIGARHDGKIDAMGGRLDGKIDTVCARLDDKIDTVCARLDGKIDTVYAKLDDKIEAVSAKLDDKIEAVSAKLDDKIEVLGEKISKQTSWMVGLLVTIAIALLGLMTGGFLWLAGKIES